MRGVESRNRLTAVRGKEGGGKCLKEGENTSQRTYMKGPWTWTMGVGIDYGSGGRLGREGPREKICNNCNSINNKTYLKEKNHKDKLSISVISIFINYISKRMK